MGFPHGFPYLEMAWNVLFSAPQVIWSPALGLRFVFYWAMVFFVWTQYAKTAQMQAQLYGKPRRDPRVLTVVAAVEGLAVGLVGSYVMTFFGVSFPPDGGGLIWVLVTALALMLINARLMCFSYAGGLVSLAYLIFGWPQVSVAGLMGLVAVLHLIESLLIALNGSAAATPVYLEQDGRQVGAFYLQRSWPVPVALLLVAVLEPSQVPAGIAMPDWWPLLRVAPAILANPNALFFLHALPAALGYGDLAMTVPPRLKTRRTAANLALYSLVLLGLSVLATRWAAFVWVVALFGPLGHEFVVRLGSSQEKAGKPYFVPPGDGVMILDVVPGSTAAKLGLGPGWVITLVNGQPVLDRDRLEEALARAEETGELRLEARPPSFRQEGGGWKTGARRFRARHGGGDLLGVIPVPEPGDDMGLVMTVSSPALRLVKALRQWLTMPVKGPRGPGRK